MPIQGTLKASQLAVAQMTLDLTKSPVRIEVMAAMIDPDTGNTVAWVPCRGNLWSTETQAALRTLLDAMENDIARSVLQATSVTSRTNVASAPLGGLGEHLGDGGDEAPAY